MPFGADEYVALMAHAWDQAPNLEAPARKGVKEVWASVGFMSPAPADMVRWVADLFRNL